MKTMVKGSGSWNMTLRSIGMAVVLLQTVVGAMGQSPIPDSMTYKTYVYDGYLISFDASALENNSHPDGSSVTLERMGWNYNYHLLYSDTNGIMRWGRSLGSEQAHACITKNHYIWSCGTQTIDLFDQNGLHLNNWGIMSFQIAHMEPDNLGHVYLLGKNANGIVVGKAQSSGNFLWWKFLPTGAASTAKRITILKDESIHLACPPYLIEIDSAGNVLKSLLIGDYGETAIFDDHSFAVVSVVADSVHLSRTDSSGQMIWQKWYHVPIPVAVPQVYRYVGVIADRDCGGLKVGAYYDFTTGNPACSSATYTWNYIWIIQTDEFGVPYWVSGSNWGEARLNDMHQDAAGYAYIAVNEVGHQAPCWSKLNSAFLLRTLPGKLNNCGFYGSLTGITHGNANLPIGYPTAAMASSPIGSVLISNAPSSYFWQFVQNRHCLRCPTPSIEFSYQQSGSTAQFDDHICNYIDFWWEFGDGQTDTIHDPSHTYAQNGIYNACLIARNNCGFDTTCQLVHVNCPGAINASYLYYSNNLQVAFQGLATGSIPVRWHWDFGDGDTSNLQIPIHNFAVGGVYNVCLTVLDSCGPYSSNTYCQTIIATCVQTISAAFGSSVNLNQVAFQDQSTGAIPMGWHWDFGDGDTSNLQHPTHVYPGNGTYTACLTVWDSCGVTGADTICFPVTINCPTLNIGYTTQLNGLLANFQGFGSGVGNLTWYWTFGDGSSSTVQNPVHSYATPGSFLVCLTVTDTCMTQTSCSYIIVSTVGNAYSITDASRPTVSPNPFNERVVIRFENTFQEAARVLIYSLDGRILFTEQLIPDSKLAEIDLKALPRGTYFLCIEATDSRWVYLVAKN